MRIPTYDGKVARHSMDSTAGGRPASRIQPGLANGALHRVKSKEEGDGQVKWRKDAGHVQGTILADMREVVGHETATSQ